MVQEKQLHNRYSYFPLLPPFLKQENINMMT